MLVHDPLYGQFAIPEHLVELATAPVVQRLSQIRLLNTPSPSIAALGEVRRYSHTLGVLFLCLNSPLRGYSKDEHDALAASALLHDIGTPPFAHLVEYHLRERQATGWNHEEVIDDILWHRSAPENVAHQIFARRTTNVQKILSRSRIDFALVEAIVKRTHPLSMLLFGTLDFDNLDNVARMAWGLGLQGGPDVARTLSSTLSIGRRGVLQLDPSVGESPVSKWGQLRRDIYNILLFDPYAIAAQAILSKAIGIALDKDILSHDDWDFTDEKLIAVLEEHSETKSFISREFYETLPARAFTIHLNGSLASRQCQNRGELVDAIERALSHAFPNSRPLGYVIVDQGTFEKELTFENPNTGGLWAKGTPSQSLILHGFIRLTKRLSLDSCTLAARLLLSELNVLEGDVRSCTIAHAKEGNSAQRTFTFSPA